MYIYFDWMSILSGVAYYHLKFKLGEKQLVEDVIEGIRNILGYEKNKDLQDMAKSLPSGLKVGLWEDMDKESVSIQRDLDDLQVDEFGNVDIQLLIKDFGTPAVVDYEDEEMRMKVVKPEDIVIKDEKINIRFTYPLSTEVIFSYENKGGFTRLDLYRCIYEGYKQIYDEEEEVAGDPGTYQNLMNRRRSDGPYGIWGHYLSELWIEGILRIREQLIYHKFPKLVELLSNGKFEKSWLLTLILSNSKANEFINKLELECETFLKL